MRIFFHYGHRTLGFLQHSRTDTAQQSCVKSIHTAAAHDDHIAVTLLGKGQDGFCGTARPMIYLMDGHLRQEPSCPL